MALTWEKYQSLTAGAERRRTQRKVDIAIAHRYSIVVPGAAEPMEIEGSRKYLENILSRACLRIVREEPGEVIKVITKDLFGAYATVGS